MSTTIKPTYETSIERFPGTTPTPKLVIRFAHGTGLRTMNQAMFAAAAAVEAATPDRETWIVQAQHRGAADRVVVTIELARGTDDEADRALAVLQAVAVRAMRPTPSRPGMEELTDGLDKLLDAERTKVRRGIDAAACRTKRDWDASHKADDDAAEARETFDALLHKAVSR